jgi:hypothetical protein
MKMDRTMNSLEAAWLKEWEGGCSYEEEQDDEYTYLSVTEELI